METTKWWALGLVVLCTLFTSSAQLLLKQGVMTISAAQVLNLRLFSGLVLYVIAAMLLIIALKFGELSVLYPAIATSFIWVNLLSMTLLGEEIPLLRWLGVGFIMLGISMIGLGSKTLTKAREVYFS